jgi:hypothetical protein
MWKSHDSAFRRLQGVANLRARDFSGTALCTVLSVIFWPVRQTGHFGL